MQQLAVETTQVRELFMENVPQQNTYTSYDDTAHVESQACLRLTQVATHYNSVSSCLHTFCCLMLASA